MQSNSIEEVIDNLTDAYKGQVSEVADTSTSELMSSIYNAALPTREPQEQEAQDEGNNFDDKTIAEIIRANAKVAATTNNTEFANHLAPVTKSAVDRILSNSYDRDDLKRGLLRYYVDTATSNLRPQIAQAFSSLGLQQDEQAKRTMVFNEINRFSFWNYLISIILRMLPVLLFGFIFGFLLFDRDELLSIALAGGLAAFLLSWPLILMWDRLVDYRWVDKKSLFLVFYGLYILTFYLAARASAVLGMYVRRYYGGVLPTGLMRTVDTGIQITWRELATNIAGAIVISAATFAWNVIIPLTY